MRLVSLILFLSLSVQANPDALRGSTGPVVDVSISELHGGGSLDVLVKDCQNGKAE